MPAASRGLLGQRRCRTTHTSVKKITSCRQTLREQSRGQSTASESPAGGWFDQFQVPHPRAEPPQDCVIPGAGVGEKGRETCQAGGTALWRGPGDELGEAASPSSLPGSYSCLPSHAPCSCCDLSASTAARQLLPPGRSWHPGTRGSLKNRSLQGVEAQG